MTSREWVTAVVLGLIVSAVLLIYFPAAMVASIASGVVAAVREMRSLWPLTVGLVAGLGAVASDLVSSQRLIGFHLALGWKVYRLSTVVRSPALGR